MTCGDRTQVVQSGEINVVSDAYDLEFNDIIQRLNVGQDEVRAWHRIVERDTAAVDPRDGQSERLSTDQIGELRLAGMEDLVLRDAGIVDQVAEQRSVRLV